MKSTERFTDRVENYVRYRPRYGQAVIELLRREIGLEPHWTIADIGSGTGFSTEPFLANGNSAYGVEPNAEMRAAGERYLAEYPKFTSVDGTAEATTLPAACVAMIVAGQAFHWFDPLPTRAEWARILVPGGWAVLMWNERPAGETPFFAAYEQLLVTYGTDYAEVNAADRASDHRLAGFYAPEYYHEAWLPNEQATDWEGLQGRLLSASYAPLPGHPNHEPMLTELRRLFERHEVGGSVAFPYRTHVIWGRI